LESVNDDFQENNESFQMRIQIHCEYDDTDEHYGWNSFALLLGLFASKAKALAATGEANRLLQCEIKEIQDRQSRIRKLRFLLKMEGKTVVFYAAYDTDKLIIGSDDLLSAIIVEPTENLKNFELEVDAYRAELQSSTSGNHP
jgi:hypothetical protein